MPKCPKCGIEINHLSVQAVATVDISLILESSYDSEKQKTVYDLVDYNKEINTVDYTTAEITCPRCGEELPKPSGAHPWDVAEEFLKGES